MKKMHSEKHMLLYGTAHDREEKERTFAVLSGRSDSQSSSAHNFE